MHVHAKLTLIELCGEDSLAQDKTSTVNRDRVWHWLLETSQCRLVSSVEVRPFN